MTIRLSADALERREQVIGYGRTDRHAHGVIRCDMFR